MKVGLVWEHEDQHKEEVDYNLSIWRPLWRGGWVQLENMKTDTRRGKLQLQVHEDHCEGEDGSNLRTQRPT
jgi:hypothetical protein